ncbi:hypothetical protein E3N88_03606 [Mikania micrantha]|uniref:Uncharacterized protein n=1 Tax=Mikania micrantha TaxID=192012 RepID=A0A5N6Q9Y7_9ASTR|nr:hypothetical protein E3N88_03606 [Mikania micrantha]
MGPGQGLGSRAAPNEGRKGKPQLGEEAGAVAGEEAWAAARKSKGHGQYLQPNQSCAASDGPPNKKTAAEAKNKTTVHNP